MLSNRPTAAARNKMDLYVVCAGSEKFFLLHWCRGVMSKTPVRIADTLIGVRMALPRHVVNIGRTHGDSPEIVEIWT